jgi:hypothetical protein
MHIDANCDANNGNTMKAITLRNLPVDMERQIHMLARQKRLSLNKVVISLLEEKLGMKTAKKKTTRYRDLDVLAGSWSEAEAREFDKALAQQRNIDPELWK